MGLTLHSARLLVAALVAALAGLCLIGGVAAEPASAASACKRHGNKQPENLTQKRARNAIVCLINKKRRHHGRSGLDRDWRLGKAARRHSDTMASKSCFSHQCSGEGSLYTRLRSTGYLVDGLSRWAYGENIAYGLRSSGTPKKIVGAWMNSSGHRANILSRTFRDIGVGFTRKGDKGYYTTDFGLRIG